MSTWVAYSESAPVSVDAWISLSEVIRRQYDALDGTLDAKRQVLPGHFEPIADEV